VENENTSKVLRSAALWILPAVALSYALIRVWALSITHDEALSFLVYVPRTVKEVFGLEAVTPLFANNHVLNTLLIKLVLAFAPASEVAVRLPSLAGQLLYVFGCLRILKRYVSVQPTLVLALLLFHPFLLDFFSLARGYALALGLATMGLSILNPIEKFDFGRGTAGLLLVSLSVTSVLSFLHLYAATIIVYSALGIGLCWQGRLKMGQLLSGLLGPISLSLIPLVPYLWIIPRARSAGAFFIGGENGFLEDTAGGLITATLYRIRPDLPIQTLDINWWLVMAGCLVVFASPILALACRLEIVQRPIRYVPSVLVGLVGLFSVMGNQLFNVNYLTDRSAIYLLPLCTLAFAGLLDLLGEHRRHALAALAYRVLIVAGLAVTVHFASCLQFRHTLTWAYDTNTKGAFLALLDDVQRDDQPRVRPIRLGTNWVFAPSLNFYRVLHAPEVFAPIQRTSIHTARYDYYYVLAEFDHWGTVERQNDLRDRVELRELRTFPDTHTSLLKRSMP
jgi:hypothetical protein